MRSRARTQTVNTNLAAITVAKVSSNQQNGLPPLITFAGLTRHSLVRFNAELHYAFATLVIQGMVALMVSAVEGNFEKAFPFKSHRRWCVLALDGQGLPSRRVK